MVYESLVRLNAARKSDGKDLIIWILANAINRDHEANCVDVWCVHCLGNACVNSIRLFAVLFVYSFSTESFVQQCIKCAVYSRRYCLSLLLAFIIPAVVQSYTTKWWKFNSLSYCIHLPVFRTVRYDPCIKGRGTEVKALILRAAS